MMSSAQVSEAQDRAAVEFAQHQRADAERIARADQLLVGERDQRVGALDLRERLDEAVDDARAARAGRKQEHDLGVGGRLADRAVADQFAPQRQAVGEIAVVGDREAAGVELGEQRLDVAQDRLAGGGIADMADRGGAGQALDRRGAGEMVADQPEAPLGMEPRAVEGDDARRLLAAMLQGVQAERGDRRRVGMAENAEYAAFLAQTVALEIERLPLRASSVEISGLDFRDDCPSALSVCAGVGTTAGAAGDGIGTPLLISASSFCLSANLARGRAARRPTSWRRGRRRRGRGGRARVDVLVRRRSSVGARRRSWS